MRRESEGTRAGTETSTSGEFKYQPRVSLGKARNSALEFLEWMEKIGYASKSSFLASSDLRCRDRDSSNRC